MNFKGEIKMNGYKKVYDFFFRSADQQISKLYSLLARSKQPETDC
jgi:hypothetical protein